MPGRRTVTALRRRSGRRCGRPPSLRGGRRPGVRRGGSAPRGAAGAVRVAATPAGCPGRARRPAGVPRAPVGDGGEPSGGTGMWKCTRKWSADAPRRSWPASPWTPSVSWSASGAAVASPACFRVRSCTACCTALCARSWSSPGAGGITPAWSVRAPTGWLAGHARPRGAAPGSSPVWPVPGRRRPAAAAGHASGRADMCAGAWEHAGDMASRCTRRPIVASRYLAADPPWQVPERHPLRIGRTSAQVPTGRCTGTAGPGAEEGRPSVSRGACSG